MFLKTSRYYKQNAMDVKINSASGIKTAKAVTLRRLLATTGEPFSVKGNDRLDVISQLQYKNSTRFWHIADANTELQANDLVNKIGQIIKIPEK